MPNLSSNRIHLGIPQTDPFFYVTSEMAGMIGEMVAVGAEQRVESQQNGYRHRHGEN